MAGNAYVYKRLWNPGLDCIYGDTSDVLHGLKRKIKGTMGMPRYFEIYWAGATQAGEELGTAANSVKDGTTTPFQLTVVSSSANDTNTTAGHVRKVAVIGVSVSEADAKALDISNAKLTVEVVNMNGTTDVLSSRYYLRVIHAYACDWGTGDDDAAGSITVESPANTALLTIAANANESNSGILYFADGDMPRLDCIDLQPYATQAAADGCFITVASKGFENAKNLDPDYLNDYYLHLATRSTPTKQWKDCWKIPRRASKMAEMKFIETLVANSITYKIWIGVELHNRALRS